MVGTMMTLAMLVTSPSAAHSCDAATSMSDQASLEKAGLARILLRDREHCIVAILTVSQQREDWPESFVIGPPENGRTLTSAEIWVDGCRVEQPWPPIGGMSMPTGGFLSSFKGRWQLEIGGGDGAESWGAAYTFNGRYVLTRKLSWGPDFWESTRYDIKIDPEVSSQLCD